jgi:hypothetical protein
MAVVDDIAAERQRLTGRLERIDTERQKLADQIAELDAAERVLSRLSPTQARGQRRRQHAQQPNEAAPVPARGGRRPAQTTADQTKGAAPRRRRRAGRGGRPKRQWPEVPLGDATLRAVEVLGSGVSAEQIREYLGRELSMQVRPNHLGMALQRHRRAGRLQEEDGRWSMAQPGEAQEPPNNHEPGETADAPTAEHEFDNSNNH